MTKTKKPLDPNAFNFHGYYKGVVVCALLDIDSGHWDLLPSDFIENEDSVLEWIGSAQERLAIDSQYSPAEGMEPFEVLEIATRAADRLNRDRGRGSSITLRPPISFSAGLVH